MSLVLGSRPDVFSCELKIKLQMGICNLGALDVSAYSSLPKIMISKVSKNPLGRVDRLGYVHL